MHGHRFNGKLQSHGFQVAIGTLVMCAVFDELFARDVCCVDVDYSLYMWPSLESEQQRALDLFKNTSAPRLGYESITVKYGGRDQVREELESLVALWPELKRKLQGQVYSFRKMQDLFRRAGAPYLPEHIGVTNSQLRDMFPYVQLMRHRYNLLDLAKRGDFYNDIVDPLFAPGGVFEVR
jgi:glycerol-1-phosphate dehydrogenase [NAD(P)+]